MKDKLIAVFVALITFICIFALIAYFVFVLNHIDNPITESTEKIQTEAVDQSHFFIWTDSETGVQYIVYTRPRIDAGGGITPRLNADGSLCVVNVTENET